MDMESSRDYSSSSTEDGRKRKKEKDKKSKKEKKDKAHKVKKSKRSKSEKKQKSRERDRERGPVQLSKVRKLASRLCGSQIHAVGGPHYDQVKRCRTCQRGVMGARAHLTSHDGID